jgi:hypothetical protein
MASHTRGHINKGDCQRLVNLADVSAAYYLTRKGTFMRVTFKYGIKTFSGTIDSMVYGAYRDGNLCIGRDTSTLF